MARIVRRTRTGPASHTVDGREQLLCQCGLSATQPFCDGSHALTAGELPGALYWYDDAGKRHQLAAELPGIRSF